MIFASPLPNRRNGGQPCDRQGDFSEISFPHQDTFIPASGHEAPSPAIFRAVHGAAYRQAEQAMLFSAPNVRPAFVGRLAERADGR
jgi:hypothetical protein